MAQPPYNHLGVTPMTQPPYRPSEGDPMSRFALFAAALIVIVGIGAQTSHDNASLKSMCVCVPTRAGLIVKSAIAKTRARSTELFAVRATVLQ
jgi:hypothetical protein